ncbi:hypothetical protein Tco_0641423 [Tanacetum coccineum]
MAQENFIEGCSKQREPLIELNGFCFWKSRFETYVKSKDIDLWQVIQNGDFYFEVEDKETKLIKEMSYELLKENEKKQLGKNEEVRTLQKSQENGQNRTNTDTRRKRVYKSQGFDSKKGQKSTPVFTFAIMDLSSLDVSLTMEELMDLY